MIRLIPLLLSFLFFFSVTQLHAGAAEKWEYEPVMKDMNIHVTGHKVDQYGAAVNDYEYNTKIDPKTSVNKSKMGKVGFGRLLRITGWGMLGYEALAGLLQAVDWVIDPESQSIWRNQKTDPNGSVNCGSGYLFRYQTSAWKSCPIEAIQQKLQEFSNQYVTYKFVRYDVNPFDPNATRITFTVSKTDSSGTVEVPNQTLERQPDPNAQPAPKEYLTPEALADYANHTHPDYSNPELAPKLEPKYSPEIASDLWKPSNPWEETNSPTVQEVERKLEESQPEPKKDPELTPNPETGAFKFPPFCEIAAPVCEFIKWVKEPPETPESIDVPEKEIDRQEIKKDLITVNVRSCPADIRFDVQDLPFGIQVNKGVQMQPICDTIEPLKYVFQLMTFVFCGFILLRV